MKQQRTGARGVALVAHPSVEMYGSDRQCLETVRGLVWRGWAVTVAVPPAEGDAPLKDALEQAGAAVVTAYAPVLRRAVLKPANLLRLIASCLTALPRLRRVVRTVDPDVVYISTLTTPLWNVVARFAGRRTIVHVHEAEEALPRVVRSALATPLLLATRIIANSEATRSTLQRSLPVIRRRIAVVLNGVPGPEQPTAPRWTLERPVRLVVVGRLSPRKGVMVAVDALAELRRRGVDARLDLVGAVFAGYEWFEEELRARAETAGLGECVNLRGLLRSPWEALAEADIVLVPSYGESFGNAAAEALLAERPVIVSAVQGLLEVVRDDLDGVLVPPGDPAGLASAVQHMIARWPAARERASAARAAAEVRFSVDRYHREIVEQLSAGAATAWGTRLDGSVPERGRVTSLPADVTEQMEWRSRRDDGCTSQVGEPQLGHARESGSDRRK
jgi:glycosyltransferase involved in cell wall biosynthesis